MSNDQATETLAEAWRKLQTAANDEERDHAMAAYLAACTREMREAA